MYIVQSSGIGLLVYKDTDNIRMYIVQSSSISLQNIQGYRQYMYIVHCIQIMVSLFSWPTIVFFSTFLLRKLK